MAKRRPGPEPRHIEVLDPTWTEGEGDVRPGPPQLTPQATDRILGRLAWFSVLAAMTTVIVALSVVLVAAAVLLSEPDPVVFDRVPPTPPRHRVAARQRPAPPPTPAGIAQPEAAEVEAPVAVVERPLEAPAPAPEVPTDLPTSALVPGQLPDELALSEPAATASVAAMSDDDEDDEAAGASDTADEAPQALQADRVTVRIGSEPIGADVRVDGRFRGRTPVKLLLNPGHYEIQLTLQSIDAHWSLDAAQDERKCFALQGSELVPGECS